MLYLQHIINLQYIKVWEKVTKFVLNWRNFWQYWRFFSQILRSLQESQVQERLLIQFSGLWWSIVKERPILRISLSLPYLQKGTDPSWLMKLCPANTRDLDEIERPHPLAYQPDIKIHTEAGWEFILICWRCYLIVFIRFSGWDDMNSISNFNSLWIFSVP